MCKKYTYIVAKNPAFVKNSSPNFACFYNRKVICGSYRGDD